MDLLEDYKEEKDKKSSKKKNVLVLLVISIILLIVLLILRVYVKQTAPVKESLLVNNQNIEITENMFTEDEERK